ncbi:hypothetical protein CERSUDRAFT_118342 [Gelatoporia subvermispora B]|uniref:F-box domain-containing protein n=1 Tax=Ceriporiopsis subvermispora (strain B) TaxID=914234 RepID=M2Q7V3_CERS8|nr:hypothetical protein CERSUDRAFT_118342 [Gelatoporia subvermispora B]
MTFNTTSWIHDHPLNDASIAGIMPFLRMSKPQELVIAFEGVARIILTDNEVHEIAEACREIEHLSLIGKRYDGMPIHSIQHFAQCCTKLVSLHVTISIDRDEDYTSWREPLPHAHHTAAASRDRSYVWYLERSKNVRRPNGDRSLTRFHISFTGHSYCALVALACTDFGDGSRTVSLCSSIRDVDRYQAAGQCFLSHDRAAPLALRSRK